MIADSCSSYSLVSHLFSLWKWHYIDNKYAIFILVTYTISTYAELRNLQPPATKLMPGGGTHGLWVWLWAPVRCVQYICNVHTWRIRRAKLPCSACSIWVFSTLMTQQLLKLYHTHIITYWVLWKCVHGSMGQCGSWWEVSMIKGAHGLWVGLQASVNCVWYIFVTHVHRGFSSGAITWFGHLAMLWAVGWTTSISELYVMSWKCT